MKRIKKCLILLAFIAPLSSCDNEKTADVVTNETIFNEVVNYTLDYKITNLDNTISFHHMIDGTDTKNLGGPNCSSKNRLYTYLMKYPENKDDYYFVYIKKDKIPSLKEWFNEYEELNSKDVYNKHFKNSDDVIDGKYVLAAQSTDVTDFKVTHSNKIENQPKTLDGYTLSMCLQTKEIEMVSNASTKESLKKKIRLYRKISLKAGAFKLSEYDYSFDRELTNVNIMDYLFSFKGKRFETYSKKAENLDYYYAPNLGFTGDWFYFTPMAEVTNEGTLLPRYMSNGTDLLGKNAKSNRWAYAYYQEYRGEFLDAYIGESNEYNYPDSYLCGLFDTEKVLKIFK